MKNKGALRLSKFLARAGVGSRRQVDELIEQGRVSVNGRQAVLGQRIIPGKDEVCLDDRPVKRKEDYVYVMLHKPEGYLSSCSDPFGRPIVLSLLSGVSQRVFPVGRLDMDSEGLLILTNDGDLTYLLTHPKHGVVKEYVVEVAGKRDNRKIARLLSGIIVEGKKARADYARFLDGQSEALRVLIGVHEGRKHLVRHLCQGVGYPVKRLIRTRVGPLALFGLDKGKWRYLTENEVQALNHAARSGREGDHDARNQQNHVPKK